MPNIRTAWIPRNQIPKRRQDQHGLRFDAALGPCAFCIDVIEFQTQSFKKCPLKSRKQSTIDLSHIGNIDLWGQWPDIELVQQSSEVTQIVGRQGLLDLRAFFTKFDPLRTPSWRGSSSIPGA